MGDNFVQIELNNTVWDIPERYENLALLGSGTYGQVCSADVVSKTKTKYDCKKKPESNGISDTPTHFNSKKDGNVTPHSATTSETKHYGEKKREGNAISDTAPDQNTHVDLKCNDNNDPAGNMLTNNINHSPNIPLTRRSKRNLNRVNYRE